jgi:hypothetical protein
VEVDEAAAQEEEEDDDDDEEVEEAEEEEEEEEAREAMLKLELILLSDGVCCHPKLLQVYKLGNTQSHTVSIN